MWCHFCCNLPHFRALEFPQKFPRRFPRRFQQWPPHLFPNGVSDLGAQVDPRFGPCWNTLERTPTGRYPIYSLCCLSALGSWYSMFLFVAEVAPALMRNVYTPNEVEILLLHEYYKNICNLIYEWRFMATLRLQLWSTLQFVG